MITLHPVTKRDSICGMAIYDKPVRVLMRQMVNEIPISAGQTITKEDVLNWFAAHYPGWYEVYGGFWEGYASMADPSEAPEIPDFDHFAKKMPKPEEPSPN